MILTRFNCDEIQDFDALQSFLSNKFQNQYFPCTFSSNFLKDTITYINVLITDEEIKINYVLPLSEEFDVIKISNDFCIADFLNEFYKTLVGDIELTSFITYENQLTIPNKYIYIYLPDNFKEELSDINNFFNNQVNIPSCTLHTTNFGEQDIYFAYNTFTNEYGSIFNIINGKNKSDYISRFFSLLILLSKGR